MAGTFTHELTATRFIDTGPTQEQASQYSTQDRGVIQAILFIIMKILFLKS